MGARMSALTFPVGPRAKAEFRSFKARTPLLSLASGGVLVTVTLPEHLRAEHVDFARQLATQAAAYAVEVERRYRGVRREERAA